MDYRNTLNLPKTSFSMKANLSQNEPKILDKWKSLAGESRPKTGKKYILHDGPPYANGSIHLGHALNKILKDIIVKYKTLRGFDAPFVPGWDCHGLPVELKLLEELKVKKDEVDQKEFRRKARDFALKYVDIQRKDFIRLGIWADWQNPYLTLNPRYEARVLEVLAKLNEKGYIYRGLRPVNWCIECTTALAEAEVEYQDKVSDSIYVRFRLKPDTFEDIKGDIDILVWTTTPWTLISNVAIAVHPDLDYLLIDSELGLLICAESLLESLKSKFLPDKVKVVKRFKGKNLEGKIARHPFIERDSKVILADFVSHLEGSGCVHIAPGHGEEDFNIGKVYKLDIIMPLDNKGFFKDVGVYSGLNVRDINDVLIGKMKKEKTLLLNEKISHSYPHCWRCKQPLIFRTTQQWFLNVDHEDLRKRLLDSIEKVSWVPSQGKERISSMVSLRPDWCLSRQRLWGVPIPAIKCKKCEQVILDSRLIMNLARIVESRGCDAWFDIGLDKIIPEGLVCSCGLREFDKLKDIVDVWFESGASFYAVVKDHPELEFPSDLYLEGSDQHRGWFQVSLIPSVALEGISPFKTVLTHGFTVDADGRKMSKSLGNVISPQEIVNKYGAEILRLWVSFSDYSEDVRVSEEIVKQLVEAYRKIRNTIRFILGNLHDFDYKTETVEKDKLLEADKLFLSMTAGVLREIENYYDKFLFYKVYQKIYEFCNITLSSFYLDILKDRLYTLSSKSKERKSAQTVLWYILNFLLKSVASLLSFTAEEGYSYFEEDNKKESIFFSAWPDYGNFKEPGLQEGFMRICGLREKVLKGLEEKRAEGLIGSSLEAEVILGFADSKELEFFSLRKGILQEVFIVSGLSIEKADKFFVKVNKAKGVKCPRCWNYRQDIGSDTGFKDICLRCAKALKENKIQSGI
ncbi:MAG: isoleucine--tRNA ligase [Candidatus Omnitrophica bacterium]|nr:isoleucine--tRNA ligase [Candidatus Omnitrophota bacterium]